MVNIGTAIDRLVGLFSPQAELRRVAARAMARKVRSKYAAAKGNTNTGGWNPVGGNVNTIIGNSSEKLRERARQLVRDMPAMATAVKRVEDYTVGNGITLQARVKDPTTGALSQGINSKIEDAWKRWADQADAGGRLHFYEMQQLACRQDIEVGEYIFLKRFTRARGRFLPFDLLALEPDQLASYGATPLPGNEIHQGVEYDPRTGAAMAYHFDDPDRWEKPKRYPANQIIVGFNTVRPNQLRGVTPLAPVILLAHQLRDYLEAEISGAQRAARWLAFVTSNDPTATLNAFGGEATTDDDGNSYYSMDMGHSVVDFLRAGEQVTIANHNRPGDNFEPFVRFILRSFAAAVGVTYELVSGDYTGAQYTTSRVSRNDMLKGIEIRRGRLVRQLCEPIKKEFLFWAVTTGKLELPGYFNNMDYYQRSVWMSPGMEQLDPLREGRAEVDAVNNKLRSPQEVLQARGRDPEQVLDEWAEWKQMVEDKGLELPEAGNSALKSNPDAVANQKKGLSNLKLLETKNNG
jgi:lambda family phage portal protein